MGSTPTISTNRGFMELVKYRDAGMHSYTYFWKNKNGNTVSPYFDSSIDAIEWVKTFIDGDVLVSTEVDSGDGNPRQILDKSKTT